MGGGGGVEALGGGEGEGGVVGVFDVRAAWAGAAVGVVVLGVVVCGVGGGGGVGVGGAGVGGAGVGGGGEGVFDVFDCGTFGEEGSWGPWEGHGGVVGGGWSRRCRGWRW